MNIKDDKYYNKISNSESIEEVLDYVEKISNSILYVSEYEREMFLHAFNKIKTIGSDINDKLIEILNCLYM